MREDGFRAVFENHPRLYPWTAFLVGLVVITSIAFLVTLVWLRLLGGVPSIASDHRVATIVAIIAASLAALSMMLFNEPYTAMPGFMLGAIASIMLSGDPHGGEPFSLVIVGFATHLAFYYLIARGIRNVWSHRRVH